MHQLDLYTETMIRHQQAAASARLTRRLLIREALSARRASLHHLVLASLGRRLETWGTQLQRRYEDLPRTPVLVAHK